MIRTPFRGVSTRFITMQYQGALYSATTGTYLIKVRQSAAEEAMPQIKAVLESFALSD